MITVIVTGGSDDATLERSRIHPVRGCAMLIPWRFVGRRHCCCVPRVLSSLGEDAAADKIRTAAAERFPHADAIVVSDSRTSRLCKYL